MSWGVAAAVLAAGLAALVLAAPPRPVGPGPARAALAGPARPVPADWSGPATAGPAPARRVVLVGLPGLLWADLTPRRMPALWRLARHGVVGSLSVTGVFPVSCPGDGWLTLNAGNRAALPRHPGGPCPPLPAVSPAVPTGPPAAWPPERPGRGGPVPASIAGLPGIVAANAGLDENPSWGLLRAVAGPGRCATAAGPGAALALARPDGQVTSYLAGPGPLNRALLARCPLTVIDLGATPPSGAALRADDRAIGRISAVLPPGTLLVVTAPADGPVPHLHPIVITGPGFGPGLLASPSTRQPGLAVLTDLTPTIAGWLGHPVPGTAVGARLHTAGRAGLGAAVTALAGQDTAVQVYRTTMPWFFALVGLAAGVLFGLIAVVPWGRGAERARRRRVLARTAGVFLGSVPVASFLAGLVPWWAGPHPAAALYGMTVTWAAVLGAAAVHGPWRNDPLGPPGFVGAVTVAVIGIDLVTGSHLQLGAPFGLSALVAGRFYGLGNNAVLCYAAAGLLAAGWLGSAALRRGARRWAAAGISAVAIVTVAAAGWPGFGAKLGGTVAMVPGFLLLIAAAAGSRVTVPRGLAMTAAGVAAAAVLAVAGYLLPGHSDLGAFVGQVLHGGASATVHRKIRANVGSLTASVAGLAIPLVVAASGAVIGWPSRLRAGRLARAGRQLPLLRPVLAAIWLAALLGWLADDSGVTVPAAGLPLIVPLLVAILAAVPSPAASRPGATSPAVTPPVVGNRPARLSLSSHCGSSGEYVSAIPVVQDGGRAAVAPVVAAEGHWPGAHPARRRRHPGLQPPVDRGLDLPAAHARPAAHLRGQVGVLHRHRPAATADRRVHAGHQAAGGGPGQFPGGPGHAGRRAGPAAQR